MKFAIVMLALAATGSQSPRSRQASILHHRLLVEETEVLELWHPSRRTLRDVQRAETCWARFRRGRVNSCDRALSLIDADLRREWRAGN